jgi:hypothetical protein
MNRKELRTHFKQVAGTLVMSKPSQVEYALLGAYDKGRDDALRAVEAPPGQDRQLLSMMAAAVYPEDPSLTEDEQVGKALRRSRAVLAEVDKLLEEKE